jgi:hypothetical protein
MNFSQHRSNFIHYTKMKSACVVFCLTTLFMAHCRSTSSLECFAPGEGSIASMEEGFASDDKLIVKGNGLSTSGFKFKTSLQETSSAKQNALMDAERRAIEICRSTNTQTAEFVEASTVAISTVGKELIDRFRDASSPAKNFK